LRIASGRTWPGLRAPFPAGAHRQIAVKVIDERGNALMVVKPLGG